MDPRTLDASDSFFDLGGHSLMASQLVSALASEYGMNLSVLDLYQHSSLQELLAFVGDEAPVLTSQPRRARRKETLSGDLAFVGMAGRFPGANDVTAFWGNLKEGVASPTLLSKAELKA